MISGQYLFLFKVPGHLLADVSLSPCWKTHLVGKYIFTAYTAIFEGSRYCMRLAMAITCGVELALAFTPGDLLWGVSRSSPT